MERIAIATDSNSGITQEGAKELGIRVLPMPFYINGELYYEDITLTQEEFYQRLAEDADISTSQPAPADVIGLWEELLEEYDVSYIFVGSKEREKYGETLNEDVLKSLGEVVFQDEVYSTYILKVNK